MIWPFLYAVFAIFAMIFGLPVFAFFGDAIDCFYCASAMLPLGFMVVGTIIYITTSLASLRISFGKLVFREKFHNLVFIISVTQTVGNIIGIVYATVVFYTYISQTQLLPYRNILYNI